MTMTSIMTTRLSKLCGIFFSSICFELFQIIWSRRHARRRACYTCEHVLPTRASMCFLHMRARVSYMCEHVTCSYVLDYYLKMCNLANQPTVFLGWMPEIITNEHQRRRSSATKAQISCQFDNSFLIEANINWPSEDLTSPPKKRKVMESLRIIVKSQCTDVITKVGYFQI